MADLKHAAVGSGLIGILLITRSRSGPRLVFHYPESPTPNSNRHCGPSHADESDSETDEDEDKPGDPRGGTHHVPDLAALRVGGNGDPSPQSIFGHSIEVLEKILSPGRWCDGKKFEICVNGRTYLGHPVYALEDGNWSPKPPAEALATAAAAIKPHYGEYHMYLDPGSLASTPPKPIGDTVRDFTHMPDSLESQALGRSMESNSSSSNLPNEQMAMFHVVFVIDTRGSGSQKELNMMMYREVVLKLSKALQHCQKHSNYVSAESRRLLATRTKAKIQNLESSVLWTQMTETSELAWALKETYEQISVGEVAGIRLNGMEMSLHVSQTQNTAATGIYWDPLSALLLLETKETLLHQLSRQDASPLTHFIREHTPTKSLEKHAANLGIPINDVMFLAKHLVEWRKARAIAPLHQRNTYVVGPDAPLDKLRLLSEQYARSFSSLPRLPNMIKILSGKPIQYGLLIPSRDHRLAYMEILAFLVQHNLVIQLKTYGWLRLPKDLAKTVAALAEEIDPNKRPLSVRALLSPHLRPLEDDEVSVSSERTAIPSATTALKRLSTGTQASQTSASTHSTGNHSTSADADLVLIRDPLNPTAEEADLIAALRRSLVTFDLREQFPEIVKFFDGETAFEEIAARLRLKRARVEEWLNELEGRGVLLTVRHI